MTNHGYFDIGYMDTLAEGDSFLHRMDPRIKLITTIVFIATVISFNRYTVLGLVPFFSFPIILIILGSLPAAYILKKVLLVSPFAILVGIFNPVFDSSIVYQIGPIGISGGWISFVSILLRFTLTVTSALALVALTGFNSICAALDRLKLPRPFIVQLLFLYRYIFVLTDDAERMMKASRLRSFSDKPMHFETFVSVVEHLLLRTLDRAERIYRAMCCRGFDGRIRIISCFDLNFSGSVFFLAWAAFFILFRFWNVPDMIGNFIMRIF